MFGSVFHCNIFQFLLLAPLHFTVNMQFNIADGDVLAYIVSYVVLLLGLSDEYGCWHCSVHVLLHTRHVQQCLSASSKLASSTIGIKRKLLVFCSF